VSAQRILVFEARIAIFTAISRTVGVRMIAVLFEGALVDELSLTGCAVDMDAGAQMLFKCALARKALIAVVAAVFGIVDSRVAVLFEGVFVDEPLLAVVAIGMHRRTEVLRECVLTGECPLAVFAVWMVQRLAVLLQRAKMNKFPVAEPALPVHVHRGG
jgi:hypothetical protein